MNDHDCVAFLQWVLPQLNMRWKGFRKVRKQVCKRIDRRRKELGIESLAEYRQFLLTSESEWTVLDHLCRITISRFYRDRIIFSYLASELLPSLADRVCMQKQPLLRIWCGGCASGEEPYTLALVYHLTLKPRFPDLQLEIVATDIDPVMLARAELASYGRTSLREMPPDWIEQAFSKKDDSYVLRDQFRQEVKFLRADIRSTAPEGRFQVILCRNLAFTYFDETVQQKILEQFHSVLIDPGYLICGSHEQLPPNRLFHQELEQLPIYCTEATHLNFFAGA